MREFESKFVKMVNVYNNLENKKMEFIPDVKVSHLDAHLLDVMSKNPLKKVSELADLFGVTKGAVSQQIKKLEKRELIRRVRHNDNYREVYIELTERGKTVVEVHEKFHQEVFNNFSHVLDVLNEREKELINSVMDNITTYFDKIDKEY